MNMRERVARAITVEVMRQFDAIGRHTAKSIECNPVANAALQAIMQAPPDERLRFGCAVLKGVEPSEGMLAVVRNSPHPTRPDGWDSQHAKIFRAMIEAGAKENGDG